MAARTRKIIAKKDRGLVPIGKGATRREERSRRRRSTGTSTKISSAILLLRSDLPRTAGPATQYCPLPSSSQVRILLSLLLFSRLPPPHFFLVFFCLACCGRPCMHPAGKRNTTAADESIAAWTERACPVWLQNESIIAGILGASYTRYIL